MSLLLLAALPGRAAAAPGPAVSVGVAACSRGGGWGVTSTGTVSAFGAAPAEGQIGTLRLHQPVVGIAPTPDCAGYWLVASDGGIFSFGDATFHGSTGAMRLNKPIVGMTPTPDGGGYWLVASDGGIFSFGDATFHGSAVGGSASAVAGIASTGDGGYLIVTVGGAVSTYAPAPAGPAPDPAPSAVPDAATPAAAGQYVTRTGSQLTLNGAPFRFAGTNMYWLALDDNTPTVSYPTDFEIDDAMQTASTMGETVVRAWADTVGCAQCIEPSLGSWNPSAMQSLDYAVASARRHGIRLVLTLVDNWSYFNGGKNTYTGWAGTSERAFFTDPAVIADYEAFIDHVVSHVDPYTNTAYNHDPTIMGWETGNEVWCQTCGGGSAQAQAEASWTGQIAAHLKSVAPRQLVVDGLGVQSSCTSGCLNAAALSEPGVDVVDDHFYPMNVERLDADAAQANAASRAYLVGEYDWDNHDGGDPLAAFLVAVESSSAAGDLPWVLIPHDSLGGFQDHNDGFQFMLEDSSTDMVTRVGELRHHASTMASVPLPAPGQVAAPSVLQAVRSGGSVSLVWRGSAGAMTYSVERWTGSGWTAVASGLTDPINTGATPVGWTDWTPGTGTPQYRIAAVNLAGVTGPWSAPIYATSG
jgi:hypothetical protein